MLYKDSTTRAVFTSIVILVCNALAYIGGFMTVQFHGEDIPTALAVFLSSVFSSCILFLFLYSRKHKFTKLLKALIFTNLGLLITFFTVSAIYQPAFFGFGMNLTYIIDTVAKTGVKYLGDILGYYFTMFGTVIFMLMLILYGIFSLRKYPKKIFKKLPPINMKALASVLIVFTAVNTFTYIFSYDKYIYFEQAAEPVAATAEKIELIYDCYNSISDDMTFEQADKMLKNKGLISHSEYVTYLKNRDYSEHAFASEYRDEVLYQAEYRINKNLTEYIGRNDGTIYYFNDENTEQDVCLIISQDLKKKVFLTNKYEMKTAYQKNTLKNVRNFEQMFSELKKGDSLSDVKKKIEATHGYLVTEICEIQNSKKVVKLILNLDAKENIDTLKRYVSPIFPYERTDVEMSLTFENDLLTYGEMKAVDSGSQTDYDYDFVRLE